MVQHVQQYPYYFKPVVNSRGTYNIGDQAENKQTKQQIAKGTPLNIERGELKRHRKHW